MRRVSDDRAVFVTPSSFEISAVELRASEFGPQIGARAEVIVMADKLILDTPILASGASVRIAAREIIGGSNARIDVSGSDGWDAPEAPKPKPGLGNHTVRVDGADGSDASSAGNVEILGHSLKGPLAIIAHGGEGGTGQPGGTGADGLPGRHGRNPRGEYDGQGEAGGNGGPAGPAGRAGTPGDSGDGGQITIFLESGAENISMDVAGGPEVPPSKHGSPGRPGPLGTGGRRTPCTHQIEPCVE